MAKQTKLTRIIGFFTRNPYWLRLVEWSKSHSLPGMKRIPLYNLVKFVQKETREDAIVTRANSMAFSFFLAIFPSIIVLFTVLAYTPLYTTFDKTLYASIHEFMPGNAGEMLLETITDIMSKQRGSLLSFGFVLAIWFASNGMVSMIQGLEKDHAISFKRRNNIQKRLIAIQLTVLVALVLVASVVMVILGDTILHFVFQYIKADLLTRLAFMAFRWIVIVFLYYTTFSTIYRFGSSTHKPIPFFNPGSMLATFLSILISWGFSFYVNNFGSYNKVYGSIGTIIVLMIWIQMNCMILLIGFEINAGITVLRDRRQKEQEEKQMWV